MSSWLEKHQVALYLLSLLLGAVVATGTPSIGAGLEPLNGPALALLLLATFTCIPLHIPRGSHSFPPRFLSKLLATNFLVVPIIAGTLIALAPLDDTVAFAAALVLLAPCIDYVVVFTGIAGGAAEDLTRATPVLLLCQIVAVPLWLTIFTTLPLWENTPITADTLETGIPPVAIALTTITGPLLLAWMIQRLNTGVQATSQRVAETLMIPLTMLVLFTVIASHTTRISGSTGQLLPAALLYLSFAALSGTYAWKIAAKNENTPVRTALTFSAVTRNSLVVLPLALAISSISGQTLIPLAVITQTLIELLVMVAMVKILRKPAHRERASPDTA